MQILAVVPKNDFYVKANFKETQIETFKPGQRAYIKGEEFEGKIRNTYPATGSKFSLIPADNATGNFTKIVQRVPVIIDVHVPEKFKNKIVVGLSSSVSIRVDQ